MMQTLTIAIIALTITSCNGYNDSKHPGGFYGTGCVDANYKVETVPNELSGLIRKELTVKITHDSIIGKIPYRVSHPVNSADCETQYDEYNVLAEVNLSSGVETWNLNFKMRKDGTLLCLGCNKSLIHHPPK